MCQMKYVLPTKKQNIVLLSHWMAKSFPTRPNTSSSCFIALFVLKSPNAKNIFSKKTILWRPDTWSTIMHSSNSPDTFWTHLRHNRKRTTVAARLCTYLTGNYGDIKCTCLLQCRKRDRPVVFSGRSSLCTYKKN